MLNYFIYQYAKIIIRTLTLYSLSLLYSEFLSALFIEMAFTIDMPVKRSFFIQLMT